MTELIILNTNDRIEIDEKYGVSTEGTISDIRDLDSVSGASSKSLFITSNDEVNQIFNGIFNINAETLLFDQTVKQECELWHNEEKIMRGYFQIVNIQYVDRNQYIYELIIFDEQVNFFLEIEENLLTGNDDTSKDLDFSQYNHIWNLTNIQDSWVKNSDDIPYYYFLGNQEKSSWTDVEDFKPGFYIKNIIENIFYKYDYKLKSDFFETDLFKDIFIPFSTGEGLPKIKESELELRKFRAENTCTKSIPINNGGGTPQMITYPNFMNFDIDDPALITSSIPTGFKARQRILVPYNVLDFENTVGIFDTGICGSVDNTTTFDDIGTIENTKGQHDFTYNIEGSISVENPTGGTVDFGNNVVDPNANNNYYIRVQLIRRGTATPLDTEIGFAPAATYFILDEQFYEFNAPQSISAGGTVNTNININGTFENVQIYDQQETFVSVSLQKIVYLDNSATPANQVIGTFTLGDASLENEPLANSVTEGDEIFINQWLPQNMKQKDLLRSVFKMFNLKMMPDINEERTLIVEPRDDFYTSGNIINCNEDENFYIIDKPSHYQLVTDFQAKDIIFKYQDDGDSDEDDYGKKRLLSYKNKYKREYGEQRILFNNENLRDTRIIRPDFASTVTGYSDTINDTEITPGGSKYICGDIKAELPENEPRILFRNLLPNQFPYVVGDKTRVFRKFTDLTNPLAVDLITGAPYELVQMNEYGTGTHYRKDPFFPTFDLNFGRVRELLYNPNNLTDNNLYNSFWINEISTIDEQKMLTAYFYISNSAFKNLSYNDLLYFDKNDYSSYYIINKIIEYNVKTGEAKLELITFDPTLKFDRELSQIDFDKNPNNPSPDLPGVNVGSGNIIKSPGSITTGNNNINNGGFIKGGSNINSKGGFVIGNDNINLRKSNILGDKNIVNAENTLTLGDKNIVSHSESFVLGNNITTNNNGILLENASLTNDYLRVGDYVIKPDGQIGLSSEYVQSGYVDPDYTLDISAGSTTTFDPNTGETNYEVSADEIVMETELLRFPNLPTSATGLPAGSVWRDGNDLKIV